MRHCARQSLFVAKPEKARPARAFGLPWCAGTRGSRPKAVPPCPARRVGCRISRQITVFVVCQPQRGLLRGNGAVFATIPYKAKDGKRGDSCGRPRSRARERRGGTPRRAGAASRKGRAARGNRIRSSFAALFRAGKGLRRPKAPPLETAGDLSPDPFFWMRELLAGHNKKAAARFLCDSPAFAKA